MAREKGIYRRPDSPFWWINAVLPNGERIRQSAGTEDKRHAEALLAKLKLDVFREAHFGIKRTRSWQEAVVRYLTLKASLRSIEDVGRILRKLDPYLVTLMLGEINGDVIWSIVQDHIAVYLAQHECYEIRIELAKDAPHIFNAAQTRLEGEIPYYGFLPGTRPLNPEVCLPEYI